jgi:hypothetical protein
MFRNSHGRPFAAAMLIIILSLAVSTAAPRTQAQGNPNPGIVPNNARYRQLSAQWWQWALSAPPAVNPILDSTGANCAQGQGVFSNNNVWFLAGTFGGSATRSCTIPPGKSLFFPILNTFFACDPPEAMTACPPLSDIRAFLAGIMNNPLLLEASIDGVPVQALASYRAASSVFSLQLPADNVFGAPAGTYEPAVADGYYLLVTPGTPGPHTIKFKGIGNDGFTVEVTYHLTVGH